MPTTAQQLVNSAMEVIGRLGPGRTPGASESGVGLLYLNRLIDASNINRGNIYSLQLDTYTLVAGTQAYTIGATGVFVAPRPIRIEIANVLLTSGSSVVRRKLNLLNDYQWAAKQFLTASGLPEDLYNDADYPLSTYKFYPIPSQAYQFETYTWQQFGALASLATTISVTPGYEEYWIYSLAARLASVFGVVMPDDAKEILIAARAAVMSLNCISPRMRSDSDLPGVRGRRFYGWLDGYTGGE